MSKDHNINVQNIIAMIRKINRHITPNMDPLLKVNLLNEIFNGYTHQKIIY